MEAVATAQEQPKKSLVEIFMEGTKKRLLRWYE